jgi:hypothetical protein
MFFHQFHAVSKRRAAGTFAGRSGKIRFLLVASTHKYYQALVRGRTFQGATTDYGTWYMAHLVPMFSSTHAFYCTGTGKGLFSGAKSFLSRCVEDSTRCPVSIRFLGESDSTTGERDSSTLSEH